LDILAQISHIFFRLGKHLGKGTFGQVKLGQHTLTGEKVGFYPMPLFEREPLFYVYQIFE